MAPATITILYPTGSDATFDMSYYLNSHMPLVKELWGPEGLTGYKVTKFADPSQPYAVQCLLEFKSADEFQAAVKGQNTAKVMGDVPNFSNKQPLIMLGEFQGSG